MKRVLAVALLLGCKTEPAVEATAPPALESGPGLGSLAEAHEKPVEMPIGHFVLLRSGTRLHAEASGSSPNLLLSRAGQTLVNPIPARILGIKGAFVEVETLGQDARLHCGVGGHWTDAFSLRGFVEGGALGSVTSSEWEFNVEGAAFRLPVGLLVEASDGRAVVEVDGARLTVPATPPSVARSYPRPPGVGGDCWDGQFDALLASTGGAEVLGEGTIGLGNVGLIGKGFPFVALKGPAPVFLKTGERIGEAQGRIPAASRAAASATDPSRTCVTVTADGEGDEGTVLCVSTDKIAGRFASVPRVRQGKHAVKGALDKDIIRRIVRAHINEVRFCYNQGLKEDPTLEGRVAVDFTIGPDGKVQTSTVATTTVPRKSVGTCIADAVKGWRFPKPSSGGTVVIRYPFVLEPG